MTRKKSFFKNIFSVRNDDRNHKILTILGVKFKSKSHNKALDENLEFLKNKLVTLEKKFSALERFSLHTSSKASGKLRELQLKHYTLLEFLKEKCLSNNLTFWIQGGTLLGAYRHQGFIPWDDDLDCGMPRQDLEKLKDLLKNEPEVELVNCYNLNLETEFACRMPKIRFKKYPHIFVDIFPYDLIKIEEDAEELEWEAFNIKKQQITEELLSLGYASPDAPIEDSETLQQAENTINKYIPEQVDKEEATHIIWGIENLRTRFCRLYRIEELLPTSSLIFEDDIFPVPNNYINYMSRQYRNIWSIPKDVGELRHFNFSINSRNKINTLDSDEIVGYTAGAFDLFHIGHLNLLKRAKQSCDYLIVGVTTDELIERTKNKRPFIPLSERVDILKACKYVDKVVIQDDLDKFEAWKNYRYDVLFSGDDWKNSERWKTYEQKLGEVGARIEYFSYTKSTSSTRIQDVISSNSEKELV